MSGFVDHSVSVKTTQRGHCSPKAAKQHKPDCVCPDLAYTDQVLTPERMRSLMPMVNLM